MVAAENEPSKTPRRAISKRLRYEVLRRDNHTCRYCGGTAPDVALTVDHVTPVALGGSDDPSNLVAACRDCNSGKSATPPGAPLVADVAQDALRWAQAMQAVAIAFEDQYHRRQDTYAEFEDAWVNWTYGDGKEFPRDADCKQSVDNWLKLGMSMPLLVECIEIAMRKQIGPDNRWRYFCGVTWNRLTDLQNAARRALAAADDDPWGQP
jgi:hypothetical protein